jgi:hypothetical protein
MSHALCSIPVVSERQGEYTVLQALDLQTPCGFNRQLYSVYGAWTAHTGKQARLLCASQGS